MFSPMIIKLSTLSSVTSLNKNEPIDFVMLRLVLNMSLGLNLTLEPPIYLQCVGLDL